MQLIINTLNTLFKPAKSANILSMIERGELILLFADPARNYLVKVNDKRFHTDKGYIELSSIKEKSFGDSVKTNLGEQFYILKPALNDLIMKIRRETQIIYPKDIGIILLKSGIYPGAKIIECGTGSGSLTIALSTFVQPSGKIYTYEKRKKFLENSKKNIERYGLEKYVEFKEKDITDKFDETDIDFVMIDIGSPWKLIDAAYKSLKPSGRFATICPTFEQLTETVFTLEEKGFINTEALEVLVRRILVRRGKTRPEQRIPSHTGFLVFATKCTQ